MKIEIQNKWAVITGGSSGIGLALARVFVKNGANVAIVARRSDQLEQAKQELESLRISDLQQILSISCDVSNEEMVNRSISEFGSQFGTPFVLVNSAGITYPGEFHELNLDTFRSLMEVNYFGTVYTIKAVIDGMLKRGSGHIVNISSMAGVIGTYGYSAYGATKYAVRGLTDVIRAEYKQKGIHCYIVFPPDTDTPQLAFEKEIKPAITAELSETSGVMKADQVAEIIWKDMNKSRYTILPGFNSWFLYQLSNLLGDFTYNVMDSMIISAQKSIQKHRK